MMIIATHLATLLHWVILLIEKFEKNMLQFMPCYNILNKNSIGHLLRTSRDFFRPPPPKF